MREKKQQKKKQRTIDFFFSPFEQKKARTNVGVSAHENRKVSANLN